jgi:hypothetical protein
MPAGTGRVGGEDGGGAAGSQCLIKGECLVPGHQFLDAFDAQETGVALVGVEHLRRYRPGQLLERAQGLDPAHAQQELLLQPVVPAAAVEAVGDAAGCFVIARDVGVQEQQRDTPDVGTPDVSEQAAVVGKGQRDLQGLAVAVRGRLAEEGQRQSVRIQDRVRFLLPGVPGE